MYFSVITVNYNNRVELKKTIDSVISQTSDQFEYIVVDGGSKDGSKELIQNRDKDLSYWVSEQDKGIYDAMNKGVQVAKGKYCIFMNSGDSFADDSVLESLQDKLQKDFHCGNAKCVYKNAEGYDWYAPDKLDGRFFKLRNSICHQSLFIKTQLLKDRPYDTSYKIVADYEQLFYEVVVKNRTYERIEKVICHYNLDGVSTNDVKSDTEKRKVLLSFYSKGYLVMDELLDLTSRFKIGSRKYNVLLSFVKFMSRWNK